MLRKKRSQVKSHVLDVEGWFLDRGYPQRFVEEQLARMFKLSLEHDSQQKKKENGIPLVVAYNPAFTNLSTILRKNFENLYSGEEVRKVFSQSMFVSNTSAQKLKSFLVRSKFYPIQRTVGSSKCGFKRCQVCLNVSERHISESFQTKRQYKINHHPNYNVKCLFFLLSCKTCGLQYVGSTTDRFRLKAQSRV